MLNEFLFRHSIMGIFLSENMPLLAISVLSINALSCCFFTFSLPDISIAYRAIQPKVERVLEESNSDYTFRSSVRSFVSCPADIIGDFSSPSLIGRRGNRASEAVKN